MRTLTKIAVERSPKNYSSVSSRLNIEPFIVIPGIDVLYIAHTKKKSEEAKNDGGDSGAKRFFRGIL